MTSLDAGAGGSAGELGVSGAIVSFTWGGESFEVLAVPGQIQVFLQPGTTYEGTVQVIEKSGAVRLWGGAEGDHYLVQVPIGSEGQYIAAVESDPRVLLASPDVISAPLATATILDADCRCIHTTHAAEVMAVFSQYNTDIMPTCLEVPAGYDVDAGTSGTPTIEYVEHRVEERMVEALQNTGPVYVNMSIGPNVDPIEELLAATDSGCRRVNSQSHPCLDRAQRIAKDGFRTVWSDRLRVLAKYCPSGGPSCRVVLAMSAGNDGLPLDDVMGALHKLEPKGILASNAVIVGSTGAGWASNHLTETDEDFVVATNPEAVTGTKPGSPPGGTSYASPFVLAWVARKASELQISGAEALCMVKKAAAGGTLGSDSAQFDAITERCTRVSGLAASGDTFGCDNPYTCALLTGGTLQCWGANGLGELGDGTAVDRISPTPVPALSGVAQVALGGNHTCVLFQDGAVQCWGDNAYGQLGDGTTTNRLNPTAVPGLPGVAQIALGADHSCGLLTDGTVQCWGDNYYGQLGDGTTPYPSGGIGSCLGRTFYPPLDGGTPPERLRPVSVPGLSGVVQIALSGDSSCALLSDGTVQCWGDNTGGQLGSGTSENFRSPTPVPGLSGVAQIALGVFHGCAVLTDGTLQCWGSNYYGQLGIGTSDSDKHTPTLVSSLAGVVQISLSNDHACARLSDETARCWGYNEWGEIGDGTVAAHFSPTPVPGLSGVRQIAIGTDHTCALLVGDAVKCWGSNSRGQLGVGASFGGRYTSPTAVVF
jgi:alpha-tubulin suppressor-like RCC1 family protein